MKIMLMKNAGKLTGVLLGVFLILVSCRVRHKLERLTDPSIKAAAAVPVIKSRMTMEQLLPTEGLISELIKVDKQKSISLVYNAHLLSVSGDGLLQIPGTQFSTLMDISKIDFPDLSIDYGISLGQIANNMGGVIGTQLESAHGSSAPFPPFPSGQSGGTFGIPPQPGFASVTFSDGQLVMQVTNNLPVEITNLVIIMENANPYEAIATFNFPSIPAFQTRSQQQSLGNKTFTENMQINMQSIESPGSAGFVNIDTAATLDINLLSQNLNIQSGQINLNAQTLVDTTMDIGFSMPNNANISSMVLKSGDLEYSIASYIRQDAEIEIYIPGISKNGVPFRRILSLDYNGTVPVNLEGSFDLTGYTFDLTKGGTAKNSLDVQYKVDLLDSSDPLLIQNGDNVGVGVTLNNFTITYAEGYFGQQSFAIPADTLSISLFNSLSSASIFFEDPTFELSVTNSFGFPVTLKFNELSASTNNNGGQTLNLSGTAVDDSVIFKYPDLTNVGKAQKTKIVLDRNTSNIREVIAMPPNEIRFDLNVGSNTDGDTTADNHVTDSSYFSVDLGVVIPLYGRISSLTLQDTMDFSLTDSPDELDMVEYVAFYLNMENDFPVDVGLQVYFVSEDNSVIDSLISPYKRILKSGITNPITGRVNQSSKDFTKIVMTKDRFLNIMEAKKLIIKGVLETYGKGSNSVRFYSDYGITIGLGVEAGVKL